MNRANRSRSVAALAILGVAILVTGCGKSNANSTTAASVAPGGILGAGGCIPISGQIPFTGQGIYFSGINLVGGILPGSMTPIGQVVLGGGAPTAQFQRTGVDGTLVMSLVPGIGGYGGQLPTGYPNSIYPYSPYSTAPGLGGLQSPSSSSVTGMLQISPQTQQDIMNQALAGAFGAIPGLSTTPGVYPGTYPGGYPGTYPGTYPGGYPGAYPGGLTPNAVCVSGIAFNLGEYNGTLYGGNVYLYLNNTQHGYILYF